MKIIVYHGATEIVQRLAMHCPNNQICLLNQSLTDKYLKYDGTEPAE